MIDRNQLVRFVAALGALTLALLIVQSRVSSEGDTSETRVLYPGDNLIGWVGYPTTVEELFEQFPEADLIYRWDAYWSEYQVATREFDSGFGVIAPGMGLIVRVSSPEPVSWHQPVVADGEHILLEAGPNLVAWTGPSGTPIDLALRSVGRSFVQAFYWIAETNEFHRYDPDAKSTGETPPQLQHGDGLWVFVRNGTSWLQPSGDRPLHPLQPPPAHVRWSASFDKYLDADGIAVIATENVADEALFRAAAILDELLINRPDIRDTLIRKRVHVAVLGRSQEIYDLRPYRGLRGLFDPEIWGEEGPRGQGPSDHTPTLVSEENLLCLSSNRHRDYDVAVHELAHAIEYAISQGLGSGKFRSSLNRAYRSGLDSGLWTADYATRNASEFWATGVQIWLGVGGVVGHGFRHRDDLIRNAPELAQLIEDTIGQITLDSTCHPATAPSRGAIRKFMIRGSIVNASEAPLEDVSVRLRTPAGTVIDSGTATWPDGTFGVMALPGDYHLEFMINDCTLYHSESGVTTDRQSATNISLTPEGLDILIRLPDEFCDFRVGGRVVNSAGAPLRSLSVVIHRSAHFSSALTTKDGRFEFRFPDAGPHYFRVTYQGCHYLFNGDRLLSGHERYELVPSQLPVGADLELRLPEQACNGQILGRVVDENGDPEPRAFIGPYIPWYVSLSQVRRDGSFRIPVDRPSSYLLMVSVNGCVAYHGTDGLRLDLSQAIPLEIGKHNLQGVEIVFPKDLCDS